MFYLAQVFRNEENEITERRLLGKSSKNEMTSKQEHVIIFDSADHDLDRSKVSVDQDGNLFIEIDEDKVAALNQEIEITLRVKRMDFGRRLIAIMSIRNDAKEFTQEEIVQFMADYSDINTALLNGSIVTAKAMIQAITPDGTITTQGDKDALLNEITANEAALGYT